MSFSRFLYHFSHYPKKISQYLLDVWTIIWNYIFFYDDSIVFCRLTPNQDLFTYLMTNLYIKLIFLDIQHFYINLYFLFYNMNEPFLNVLILYAINMCYTQSFCVADLTDPVQCVWPINVFLISYSMFI